MRRAPVLLAAGVALGLALGGATVAVATSSSHPKTVKVCVTGKGTVRAASGHNKCPKHTHKVTLNRRGPTGAPGAVGVTGAQGLKGDTGAQGLKGATGEQGVAGATGEQGPKGDKGDTGPQGPGATSYTGFVGLNHSAGFSMLGASVNVGCSANVASISLGGAPATHFDVSGAWSANGGPATGVATYRGTSNAVFLYGYGDHSVSADLLVVNDETGAVAELHIQAFDPTITGDGGCHYHALVIPSSS